MTLRNFFRRIIPHPHIIREHRHLRFLPRDILHDPDIFHLTRRSTAGGVASGFFIAFIPIPGHTLFAGILAILFRVNLPLALASSLLANPLTMPAFYYFNYRVGTLLLQLPPHPVNFEFSFEWFTEQLIEIWQPLLLGSLMMAAIAAVGGYFLVRFFWWVSVKRRWALRRRGRGG